MSNTALPKDWGVYAQIESFTYSEAMSIEGFIDQFSGELTSGTKALTHNKVEWGVIYQDWWLAKVFRYDYTLKFSEDTALLNYHIENNIPIDENRPYHIFLEARHLRSSGFSIGRLWRVNSNWEVSTGLSWLSSEQFYDGYIAADVDQGSFDPAEIDELESLFSGIDVESLQSFQDIASEGETLQEATSVVIENVASATLTGNADYHYYKPALREDEFDEFSDVNFNTPRGQGYALDLKVKWQFHPQGHLIVEARDLWSRIKWQTAPATYARFEADQAALDALGVVDQYIANDIIKRSEGQIFPSLNPDEPDNPKAVLPEITSAIIDERSEVFVRNERYIQRLPRQIRVQLDYQWFPWWQTSVGIIETEVERFPQLKTTFFNHLWFQYDVTAKAAGFGVDYRYFKFALMSDEIEIEAAKYLYLNCALQVPLW